MGPSEIFDLPAPPFGVDLGARNASSLGTRIDTRLGAGDLGVAGFTVVFQGWPRGIDAAAHSSRAGLPAPSAVQAGGVRT